MRLRSSLFLFYEVNKMNKLVRNSEQLDLFNLPVLDEIIESKQEEKVLSIDPKKINKNADLFIKFKQIALAVYNSKGYSVANTFLGRMCISGDVLELTDKQWDVLDRGIDFYKKIAPIIKDGYTYRYGNEIRSYRHPEGWQGIVRDRKSVV